MMPAARLLLRPWGVSWGHVMPVRQADGITCGRWVGALWARFARFAALASPSSKLAHLRMSKPFLRILFWHAPHATPSSCCTQHVHAGDAPSHTLAKKFAHPGSLVPDANVC